jgi:cytidyltransferase-like protein
MEENTQEQKIIKPVVVAVSGYFDPLHVGHLDLFGKAKSLGDFLIVIVNNDEQLKSKRKNKEPFMSQEDRVNLIDAIGFVDKVVLSEDKDESVCETLKSLKPDVFAQGGDIDFERVPEKYICEELGIKMVQGLGQKIRDFSGKIIKLEDIEKKGANKCEELNENK